MRAVMLTTQELVGGENLSLWRRGFSVPFQGVLGALGTQRRGIKGMILRYISPQCLERSQSLTQASYVHWIINEGVSEGRDYFHFPVGTVDKAGKPRIGGRRGAWDMECPAMRGVSEPNQKFSSEHTAVQLNCARVLCLSAFDISKLYRFGSRSNSPPGPSFLRLEQNAVILVTIANSICVIRLITHARDLKSTVTCCGVKPSLASEAR